MMGSLLTKALVMAFGYAYPAYECYKTVEKNKPEIEQLRFWCQYWILVSVLTVFERFGGDAFISWLPMYSEAKLAFYIYLWYPKTKGTTYVYDTFFRPYVAKHESEIDRNLLELRARAGDAVVLYWHKAATYGQMRFFETLQYVAAQSQSSRPHSVQKRPQPQQEVQKPPSIVPPRKTAIAQPRPPSQPSIVPTPHQPPSPAKKQVPEPPTEPATIPPAPPVPSAPPAPSQTPSVPNSPTKTAGPSKPDEAEPMQVDQVTKPIKEDVNPPPPKETIIEEAIRVTRGRMRKTRSAAAAISTSSPR